LFTTWSTESGAVVMEGGSGVESAPNAPTSVAASKKKSRVELWAELWIELTARMKIIRRRT
jgi:hypothetical protein